MWGPVKAITNLLHERHFDLIEWGPFWQGEILTVHHVEWGVKPNVSCRLWLSLADVFVEEEKETLLSDINVIISASLAIRIAERSSIVIEHSSSPSVRTYALWQNGW